MRLLLLLLLAAPAPAQEGMWPFSAPPTDEIRRNLGVDVDAAWVDRLRKGVLRVNDAGTGSFVSPDGLVLTNHHVILGVLDAMSDGPTDYYRDGFAAATRAEEIPIDVEILNPVGWEDVTARVEAAADREAELEAVAAESRAATGLRSEVLEQDGRWWLYRYVEYKNVRLVFAPEYDAAYYGNDEGLTYNLDVAFLRVVDDAGLPAATTDFFAFSTEEPLPGDAVFTGGFPYVTNRDLTLAELAFERDHLLRAYFDGNQLAAEAYDAYAAKGPVEAREVRYAHAGYQETAEWAKELLEKDIKRPDLWDAARREEALLKQALVDDPALAAAYGGVFEEIERLSALRATRFAEYKRRTLGDSGLAGFARAVAAWAEGGDAPGALADYAVHDGLDQLLIGKSLEYAAKVLGDDDAFVKAATAGGVPDVGATRLTDAAYVDALLKAGPAAARASSDPLLHLALRARPFEEEVSSWYESNVAAPLADQKRRLARLRREVLQDAFWPDANWGPRVSSGRLLGYPGSDGAWIDFESTFGDYFDAQDDDPAVPVAPSLRRARSSLNPDVPLNYASSNDITGGNSGSALLDAEHRVVGLVWGTAGGVDEYHYRERDSRTLSVSAAGIVHVLRGAYGMHRLADELARGAAVELLN